MGIYRSTFLSPTEEAVSVTANAVTFDLSHTDKTVYANGTGAQTYTIPLNATVPFEIGTQIRVVRNANQTLTFAATGGVTLLNPGSALTARARYSEVRLVKTGTDTWRLAGDVTP